MNTTVDDTAHRRWSDLIFHPSLSRRKEWQRASGFYRETKQFCIDGWATGDFGKSVTAASVDNDLYSAIQSRAIREAKSDHSTDREVRYRESRPFVVNNQNWELDTTENGTVVVGFPCVSQWWYTPIEVCDDIADPVDRLVEGDAKKTRLQLYRRGNDWYCTFNVELWSPVVRGNGDENYLLGGLYEMADQFEKETGAELELVVNEEYTERMTALREKAGRTEKDYGELGFRILQILGHLR